MRIYNPRHKRRLQSWNYSNAGIYFVTFCTRERHPVLGRLESNRADVFSRAHIRLSKIGECVLLAKDIAEQRFSSASVPQVCIMPDHVHCLVCMEASKQEVSMSAFIGYWKKEATKLVRALGFHGALWQTSYYDHVVRDERDLARIMEYIQNNPDALSLAELYREQERRGTASPTKVE